MRTRLQRFLAWGIKAACFVSLLVSCAAFSSCVSHRSAENTDLTAIETRQTTPEALMEMLEQRWLATDIPGTIALFAPSRRELARENANLISARLETFAPIGAGDAGKQNAWHLDHRCHGRGEAMLIARISLSPRETILSRPEPSSREDRPMVETLWLIFEDGSWWLYSL